MLRLFLVPITLLWTLSASAVLPQAKPPIAQFRPDLDIYPQNFTITTDSASRVYIGNGDGVLIYDGEHWELTPTANGDIVRSLAYDGRERVYVGGYDDFGYLERDARGRFKYNNLSELYSEFLGDDLFADIWHLAVTPSGVFFVALEHVFFYEPVSGQTPAWKHEGRFGPIATLNDQTYLHWRGNGLYLYQDGDWQKQPGPDFLTTTFMVSLVAGDKTLLGVSPEDSWFQYDGSHFEQLPQFDAIPLKGSITSARRINSHHLVITTQLGKVIYLNLETMESDVIDVASDFIPEVATTHTGDTLVVDNLGFYSVHWPAR